MGDGVVSAVHSTGGRRPLLTVDEMRQDLYLRLKTGCLITLSLLLFVFGFTYLLRFPGLFGPRSSPGYILFGATLAYVLVIWALNEGLHRKIPPTGRIRLNRYHVLGATLYIGNLLAISVLVHFSGGVNSLFPVLYVLLAMYASFVGPQALTALLASLGVILHGILLWLGSRGALEAYPSGLFTLSERISPDRAAVVVFTLFSTMTFLFQLLGRRFYRLYESQRVQLADNRANLEALVNRRTRDLTATVEELRLTYASLAREKQGQEQFFAHVTHQLRTPIHVINSFVSNLLDGIYGAITPNQVEALHHLSGCSRNLLNLINNLLDMAKIKSGKMEVRTTRFPVFEELEKMISVVKSLAETRNVSLCLEVDPAVPDEIETDPLKLEAILLNLLHNAVKFSRDRPVSFRVLRSRQEDRLIFRVEDSGRGIPREHQERLFEPFEQLPGGHEIRGSGLGLYISRTFAGVMGGELRLFSEPGAGSIFELHLPLEASEPKGRPRSLPPEPAEALHPGNPQEGERP